ncbi:serine hydrolase domain-containing protein [Spiribacter curvatus]|uniref:serine hydrolase domain-containing protein n=1 Tax=Spiribacter curvatus TaxID=1335757 RepID=UPI001F3B5E44|nr:serine hydrolase [Spiribacter curvatus]
MILRLALVIGMASASFSAQSGDCVPDQSALQRTASSAAAFETLRTLHIAVAGESVVARGFRGVSPGAPTNVKSASKTLIAAVVGAAIERGVIEGVDERVMDVLPDARPVDPPSALDTLTIAHLLSMQAGLKRTSGEYYGAWVATDDWVASALDQPMEGEPGGQMRYSTGNTHLLSAMLQRRTGTSIYALANEWLEDAGIEVSDWMDDPQGIAFGGNQVSMRPDALLALGELYRRDGRTARGERLLADGWVEASWTIRGRSRWTNDGYGYGWFIRDFAGADGYYGWGYGGQMLYVIPSLAMTAVITSDPDRPSGRTGYRDALHGFINRLVEARREDRRRCRDDAQGSVAPAVRADRASRSTDSE